jgi:2-iminobutanoate/2-iminopropanoate deaminase
MQAAEPKVLVAKDGAPPVGPYSPGLETEEYIYVSGQGVRDSKGEMPSGIEAQTKQCIENVRVILESAGLTLDHVSAVQLYLADLENLPVVEALYKAAFRKNPPRVTLGVARMPTNTTVEITVVARKPAAAAAPPPQRVYLPAVYGATMREAEAKLRAALQRRGMTMKNVLFANRYEVGARDLPGVVPVHALPDGARNAIFAVAAREAANPPKDLAFCEVTASDPKGSIEDQTTNVFLKLNTCLGTRGMSLTNAVATNVYINDIEEFGKMNGVYASFFPGAKPTRTTVQPLPPAKKDSLVRISVVAVK